jgi:hypothetical protein
MLSVKYTLVLGHIILFCFIFFEIFATYGEVGESTVTFIFVLIIFLVVLGRALGCCGTSVRCGCTLKDTGIDEGRGGQLECGEVG